MALLGGKHVMLSYNHKSKTIVQTVYNILTAESIPTWFDERDMDDNMYDSMAEAVNDAAVVCCFMTPEYENSRNCKLELEHAQTLNKRIIPCMVSNRKVWKPSPSKWLGIITGSIIALDMSDTSEEKIREKVGDLINRIKNQSSCPMTAQPITQKASVFSTIRDKYLTESRIKRLVNEEKSFSIEQSYINLAILESKEQEKNEKKLKEREEEMQDHSKHENIDILGAYEEIYGSKETIDVKKILEKCKNATKKVLVLGRAGIGKSTFCRYISYRWAKNDLWPEYELVVLIPLRSLTNNRYPALKIYSPVDVVHREYLPLEDIAEEEKVRFKEKCDKGKVLWILDGYDEFAQNIPEQLKDFFNYVHEKQNHILTSRPYAVALPYDVKMEITGFTDDNITEYVELFFDQLKDDVKNISSKSQSLLNFLQSNSGIRGIAHIPVNLELICSLWAYNDWSKKKTLTLTALYDNIIEWLCRRHLERQNKHLEDMTKYAVYKECDAEIQFLEHLAFKGMERNKIVLPAEFLEEIEKETKCLLYKHPCLLNLGVIKTYDDQIVMNRNAAKKQHYFVHLSFQEHFAARHLLRMLKSSNKQKAIDFINDNKYNHRFLLVFVFSAGLLSQSDYSCCMEKFWSTVQGEPIDLVGIKHVQLIIACLDELEDTAVFPQRLSILQFICTWLDICVDQVARSVRQNILSSFKRTNFLGNNITIQKRLIRLIKTSNDHRLLNALDLLSNITISEPHTEIVSEIQHVLGHKDRNLRRRAFQALGNIGEKAATNEIITALIDGLRDEYSSVRSTVCRALGNIGEKTVNDKTIFSLMYAVRDTSYFVSQDALTALENMGKKASSSATITILSEALQKKHNWGMTHYDACEVLGRIGKKVATNEIISGLINALQDEDFRVRSRACEAIGEIGEKAATNEVISCLISVLQDKNPDVRFSACKTLGEFGEKAITNEIISALMNMLRDEDSDAREKVGKTLRRIIEKAEANVIAASFINELQSEDSALRFAACEAIRYIGKKAAMNEVIICLINILHDEDSNIRWGACKALGSIGETAATNEVISGLMKALHDEDCDVRYGACEALGKIGNRAATIQVTTDLVSALQDEDLDVRCEACKALAEISETIVTNEVIDGLTNALQDEDSNVRCSACKALGKIGEKAATNEVIDGLINRLRDKYFLVRRMAFKAIRSISGNAPSNLIMNVFIHALGDDDEYFREEAHEALLDIAKKTSGIEIITVLIYAVRDENSLRRCTACQVFRDIGEKAATDDVITTLNSAVKDQFSYVRCHACQALGSLGEKAATNEVISNLINALQDEDEWVKRYAYEALGKFGEKAATISVIAALMNLLEGKNHYAIKEACEALGKIGEKATTNVVIISLVDGITKKLVDMSSYYLRSAFERAITSYQALKALDSRMISKLFSCMRHEDLKMDMLPSDQLVNVLLETGNTDWASLIAYCALVQGVAVTFTRDMLRLYDMKGVFKFQISKSEIMNALVEAFNSLKKELKNNTIEDN